ncbi:hyalin-like [Ptychodera flava]|uniref:hyalin-like n=1 Tax=Ptychodera flava TaxID=63121 RepID=UPI00396A6544
MATGRKSCACQVICLLLSLSEHYVHARTVQNEGLSLCTFEDGFNRPGLDMAGMPLSISSSEDCCAACIETFGCKAWAYRKPGDNPPVCFLKHSVPDKSASPILISGFVQDSEQPVVICPPNIETDLEPNMRTIQVSWMLPNASDNSGTVRVSGNREPGSNFTTGVTAVSYEAEDPMGNTASCEFTVTVRDSAKPVITCPPGIKTTTYIHMPHIPVTWEFPNATDNSGSVTVTGSHEPGSNFTIGVTIVSYVAEDTFGNTAECWFSVTIGGMPSKRTVFK